MLMREQTLQVVEQYIDAVSRNDNQDLPLDPDVIGVFPTNTYRGAEAYRQGLEPFARIVKNIEVLRLVADGEHCVALLNLDTVFGPIALAEHIQVTDGQIVAIRGYYDPRPMMPGAASPA
jgi:SnoaL-like protein